MGGPPSLPSLLCGIALGVVLSSLASWETSQTSHTRTRGASPKSRAPLGAPAPPVLTADWFSGSREVTFKKHLGLAEGALPPPALKYLEVGSMEGLSARWVVSNVLSKSPGAELHCVDPFLRDNGGQFARFSKNTAWMGGLLTVHRGFSRIELSKLIADGGEGTFDFVYIDGSHDADDVFGDVAQGFWLTKVGGILALDDYTGFKPASGPLENRPEPAINAFLAIFGPRVSVLSKGKQLWVRRER